MAPLFTLYTTRLGSNALPLIVQNLPMLALPPSPTVQTAETFDGTASFGAG